ncbi:MAG: DUF134 domain-containing protein [Candidatus Omnitrophica bacterium]|nr:DUF134 domain-containing protein [Candidatus Omnitrophota bacterium]
MKKGRQKKVRYVQEMPKIAQFSPRGKAGRPDEAEILIDQFEAIKLFDYQGYSQTEGAQIMGISRPSFGRILRQGRKIIAEALVNAKTIRIRIGDVQVGVHQRNMPQRQDISAGQATEQAIRDNIFQFTSTRRHIKALEVGASISNGSNI